MGLPLPLDEVLDDLDQSEVQERGNCFIGVFNSYERATAHGPSQ